MTGPREEDGDYAGEFFGTYEREADRWGAWENPPWYGSGPWIAVQTLPCGHPTPRLHDCGSCREKATP